MLIGLHLEITGSPSPRALFLAGDVVARFIHGQALFGDNVARNLEGQTERVVQEESRVAGDEGLAARLDVGDDCVEPGQALIERAQEAFLFIGDGRLDEIGARGQFRESVAHHLDDQFGQFRHEGAGETEFTPVADGAPQHHAQHIALPLVGRQHAIPHEKHARADVVGDDAVGHKVGLALGVGLPGEDLCFFDDGPEKVGVVVVGHALQQGNHALEAHARIDVFGRKRLQLSIAQAVVLDEHQVPDFRETGAVAVDAADVTRHILLVAGGGAAVVVDLAAGAARAGVGHRPEVVFTSKREDVVGVDVGFRAPIPEGFIVAPQIALVILENGGPEAVFVQPEDARQQIPGPGDGLLLVIVAKRPVAQHLEERVVRAVVTDFLQIVVLAGDAHTLLRVGGAGVGPGSRPQEHVLELVHTGIGEQQRRIIDRHKAGAGHNRVSTRSKVTQEGLADFGAGQFLYHSPSEIVG